MFNYLGRKNTVGLFCLHNLPLKRWQYGLYNGNNLYNSKNIFASQVSDSYILLKCLSPLADLVSIYCKCTLFLDIQKHCANQTVWKIVWANLNIPQWIFASITSSVFATFHILQQFWFFPLNLTFVRWPTETAITLLKLFDPLK